MKLVSPSSQLPATARFLLGVAVTLIICFSLQAFCYYYLDWRTGKGESNYFSTLGRFQAAARGPAEIAFAGSSITGRLPGREVGNESIANLGSDGGPALDGIRMLVSGKIPLPRCLVIETNTLYGGVGFGNSLMAGLEDSLWFEVGTNLSLLGASARPTSMLYSALLKRPKTLSGEVFPVRLSTPAIFESAQSKHFHDGEKKRLDEYRQLLATLKKKNVGLLLVKYPAGNISEREIWLEEATVAILSNELGILYLNLASQIPRDQLQFTDSVHLGNYSAASMVSTIQAKSR
jgi:hypothetical protein